MSDTYTDYNKYLSSKEWALKKKDLRNYNYRLYGFVRCGLCGCRESSSYRHEAHHKTYERFGNERLSDLVFLCKRCHGLITTEEKRNGKISLDWWEGYRKRFEKKWINNTPHSLNTFLKGYKRKKSIKKERRKEIRKEHQKKDKAEETKMAAFNLTKKKKKIKVKLKKKLQVKTEEFIPIK